VRCLGAAWLLVLTALPADASHPSRQQASQESSGAATVGTDGQADHADVGMPESGVFVIRYDHILDRRTGLHRRSVRGLRMLHAVLRL
jgi:hypothetical protein